MKVITRRQQQVFNYLRDNTDSFSCPPSLAELCVRLGMTSRGSLYKHIMALIEAGLIEPFTGNKQGGIRLILQAGQEQSQPEQGLPFIGVIAAGKPIEALATVDYMTVPDALKTEKPCYVLQVKGDSMIEAGIFDGDWVVIEQHDCANNSDIVVALIDNAEATLKYLEQGAKQVLLLPANANMTALSYRPEQVVIQGVLVGQMRSYRVH